MNAGAETLPVAKSSPCAEDQASVSSAKKIFIIISWVCSSECCELTAGPTLLLFLLLFRVVRNFQAVMYRNRRSGRCDTESIEKLRALCLVD